MGLRGWIKRLEREAREDVVLVHQRDGSVKAFDKMHVMAEMFLAKCDLFKGQARTSEVLEAARNATPESRRAFEREHGEIEMEARIIAAPDNGGWVEVLKLTEDGRVEKVRYEGGPEAERLRREARERSPAF